MNALLDGTWDEYLAKHPEKAEKPADGAATEPDAAPASYAPEQDPTERNTNDD